MAAELCDLSSFLLVTFPFNLSPTLWLVVSHGQTLFRTLLMLQIRALLKLKF